MFCTQMYMDYKVQINAGTASGNVSADKIGKKLTVQLSRCILWQTIILNVEEPVV